MSQDISAKVAALNKANDLTGFDIPESEAIEQVETKLTVEEPKVVETKVEETKSETKSRVSEEEIKEEETEEESKTPAKNERPLKAIFSQIKELRDEIKAMKSSPAKAEAAEVVDKVAELAKKYESDPEGLKAIMGVLKDEVLADLEKSGKLSKDLPDDIKKKLTLLDEYEKESKERKETAFFEKEFSAYVPDLEKQYPNAKSSELVEAKKLLNELSHSKEFHNYSLDYVVFKNKSKFDALLKVAKHSKSGESASKQIVDDEEKEINLDPEDMTPEKMKAYQNRQANAR